MEEFVRGLSSGGWWLSVVVVGLALNVASNYIYKWIDKAGSSFSSRLSARSARRIEQFNREVARLIAHPGLVPYYFQMETRVRLQSIQFLIFGSIFALAPLLLTALLAESGVVNPATKVALKAAFSLLMLCSALSVLMAHRSMLSAIRTRSILNKSRIALGIV